MIFISFSTKEYFVGTESTYTVFRLCTCMPRSNRTRRVARSSSFFLLFTIRPCCNHCGKVAEQLFANQLTSPHPVLKEKLPRTATWLWRLADKGCVQHRCRAKKAFCLIGTFGSFLHRRWELHSGYCGSTKTYNETHQTAATADQTIRQRRCGNSPRD